MKITMRDTKGCGKMSSNNNYFSHICFRGAKTAEEMNTYGVDYCGPAKTSHRGFLMAMLEKLIKECPGGSHNVMKSTPRFRGDKPLMTII